MITNTKFNQGIAPIIAIIIGLIVVAGIVGIVMTQKKAPVSQEPLFIPEEVVEISQDEQCTQANWQALLPQVQNVISTEFAQLLIGSNIPISIGQEVDLTGDGCTEAIVGAGFGGAYTSSNVIMTIENGAPVIAKIQDQNGQIGVALFDAGASVKNQLGYELLSNQNGYYTYQKNYDEQNNQLVLVNCAVDGYVWNNISKLFEYNSNLVQSVTPTVCSN